MIATYDVTNVLVHRQLIEVEEIKANEQHINDLFGGITSKNHIYVMPRYRLINGTVRLAESKDWVSEQNQGL